MGERRTRRQITVEFKAEAIKRPLAPVGKVYLAEVK
jgi:hypothetical protein